MTPSKSHRPTTIKESTLFSIRSPCCGVVVYVSRSDGVLVGSCAVCGQDAMRVNPRNGRYEWLDSASPWYDGNLRLIDEDDGDVGGE